MSFYARDQKENDDVDVGERRRRDREGEKMKLEVVVCRERENGEGRKMRLAWLAAGVSIGFGSRTDRGEESFMEAALMNLP